MQTKQRQSQTPSDAQWPQGKTPSTETEVCLQHPPTARELGILADSGINMEDEETLRLGLVMLRAFD